jgi:hypothetical protein
MNGTKKQAETMVRNQKIARHPRNWASNPPMTGPSAGTCKVKIFIQILIKEGSLILGILPGPNMVPALTIPM